MKKILFYNNSDVNTKVKVI